MGRIGTGSLSCRGILISRRKSSRNRRKVFSSAVEPAIISHSWTNRNSSDRQNTNFAGYVREESAGCTSRTVGALPGYYNGCAAVPGRTRPGERDGGSVVYGRTTRCHKVDWAPIQSWAGTRLPLSGISGDQRAVTSQGARTLGKRRRSLRGEDGSFAQNSGMECN